MNKASRPNKASAPNRKKLAGLSYGPVIVRQAKPPVGDPQRYMSLIKGGNNVKKLKVENIYRSLSYWSLQLFSGHEINKSWFRSTGRNSFYNTSIDG